MFDSASLTRIFGDLLEADRNLAKIIQNKGCPYCGDLLDVSHYARKPRGVENLSDSESLRLSFCCRRDGCRKRVMPPSLRFLGRKVYWSVIVVLSATPWWQELGLVVCRLTLGRWRRFWSGIFDFGSPFAKAVKVGLLQGFDFSVEGVLSSHGAKDGYFKDALAKSLRLFSPLSTRC